MVSFRPGFEIDGKYYSLLPFTGNDGVQRMVERTYIDQFPQVIREQGQQRQSQIRTLNRTNFGPFIGGFGLNRITDPDKAENFTRFWDSTADTRWRTGARLEINSVPVSTIGDAFYFRKAIEFEGALWGFFEDENSIEIFAVPFDATNDEWDETNDGFSVRSAGTGNEVVVLDAIHDSGIMVVLYAGDSSGGNDHITRRSGTGATWSTATTPLPTDKFSDAITAHEDIDGGLLAKIGTTLVAAIWDEGSDIEFYESTDRGDNWSAVTGSLSIPSENGPQGLAVFRGIDGTDKLYLGTREGLYEIDTTGTWTETLIFPMSAHTNNFRGMAVGDDNALWFAQGVGMNEVPIIYRMTISGDQRMFTPAPGDMATSDGLPSNMLGAVTQFVPHSGFMYMAIGGSGTDRHPRILCHNGLGWHHMWNGNQDAPVVWFGISAEPDGQSRLHYTYESSSSLTTKAYLPDPSSNPGSGVSIARVTQSYIDLPFFDGGMPNDLAAWIKVAVDAADLSADTSGEHINLDYGVDGTARDSFTDLGNAVSGTKAFDINSGAGVESEAFAAHAFLIRDAGTDTDTPTLRSVQYRYLKRPERPQQFRILIDLEQTAKMQGRNTEAVIADLEASADKVTLVKARYFPPNVDHYVTVNLDWQEEFDESSGGGIYKQRWGRVLVTLAEVEG